MELNEDYYKKIALTSIETPIPFTVLCESIGVPKTIFFKWIAKGEVDIKNNIKSIYSKFFKAIRYKEFQWISTLTEKFIVDNDKPSQWLLERLWPDIYYDIKNVVSQYAKRVDDIELSLSKVMLPSETALAKSEENANKFDVTQNKGTNYDKENA